jgi:antitoxin component YwqK of YwqJK toxin-antitoxin module
MALRQITPDMKNVLAFCLAVLLGGCSKEAPGDQATAEAPADIPQGTQTEFPDTPGLAKTEVKNTANIITSAGYWLNGKKEGSWAEYSDVGSIKNITTYINGKKEGLYTEFNTSNQLVKQCTYHNDLRHGEYREYNGTIPKEIRHYEAGKQEGITQIFYDTGKIMEEGSYKDGLRDGVSKWYDMEGKLTIEYEYNKGQLVKK